MNRPNRALVLALLGLAASCSDAPVEDEDTESDLLLRRLERRRFLPFLPLETLSDLARVLEDDKELMSPLTRASAHEATN